MPLDDYLLMMLICSFFGLLFGAPLLVLGCVTDDQYLVISSLILVLTSVFSMAKIIEMNRKVQ